MKHKNTKKIICGLAALSFFFLLSAIFVPPLSADTTTSTASSGGSFTYNPMEKIPGFESGGTDWPSYVVSIYKFGLWTVGIAALLMIMVGGFMYIMSAGNTASMGKAKSIITDAIIGLIMALSAWLILNTINPDLLKVNPLAGLSTGPSAGNPSNPTNPTNPTTPQTGAPANCSGLNDQLNSELGNASAATGVPPSVLAAFEQTECAPSMTNASACGTDNSKGAGGPMQFKSSTWDAYGCSGSKFNRQDALTCAGKKIAQDSGGDYSNAGITKAASKYLGNCGDDGSYCNNITSRADGYKNTCGA